MGTWLSKQWLILLMMLMPVVLFIIVYDQLPDDIPTHWNARGELDGTMPKPWGLLPLPLIMLFLNVMFWVIPVLDPKKNVASFRRPLFIVQLLTNLLFVVLALITAGVALGMQLDVPLIISYAVIFLLLTLGNFMGKFRPNYFVGIRTPWTLESEEVWMKTHKLAGWIWVGCSLGLLGLRLWLPNKAFYLIFIPVVLFMAFAPMGYSWWLYRQQKQS